MTHKLRHLWLLATVILATASSCTQDDGGEPAITGGDPIVFTATGITPLGTATRATVDGTWEGEMGVTVTIGKESKRYVAKTLSDDKKTATLEPADGVEPFQWSSDMTGEKVKAARALDTEVNPDQSIRANYEGSDIISAEAPIQAKEVALEFKHQVARMVITVGNGDIENDEVRLRIGDLTITPYRDTDNSQYLALVNPQNGANITVKIQHAGKDYIYCHTDKPKLEAGNSYAINVKINEVMHITDEATLKAWAAAVEADPNHAISAIVDNDFTLTPPAAEGGSNWEPVKDFRGIFDGNEHTISGIEVVVSSESEYAGFIANNRGTVKNLTLNNAKITGKNIVGAVAGGNTSTIENCHVTGGESEITGSSNVGGVAGNNMGKILACHVAKECKVSGSMIQVGGIVGYSVFGGQIIGCYALCSLEGKNNIGGICGISVGTSITACYSKCSYIPIYANPEVGGIAGTAKSNATFSECYWQGDTKCTKGVGSATTNPDGVEPVGGKTLDRICEDMNNELHNAGVNYEYYATAGDFSSADEPFKLRKNQ